MSSRVDVGAWVGSPGWSERPTVRLTLLGGFRAEHRIPVPETAWQQRRSAKTLVKLLACRPGHSLHREQILELLWPELEFSSALNSFAKALHVARRALEPNLPARGTSSYLQLSDDVLTLVADAVWIDADHFQHAAEEALRLRDVPSLDGACALYTGEFLPGDTYKSWTTARRNVLADLYLRALTALSEGLERAGERALAIERLTQVLEIDSAREDVHRRLMALHASSGRRLLALRQFQLCCEALRQEVDAEPEASTVALYQAILSDQMGQYGSGPVTRHTVTPLPPRTDSRQEGQPATPLIGRGSVLAFLDTCLEAAEKSAGTALFVTGPLGVGKTRVAEELIRHAASRGFLVLRATGLEVGNAFPFAPLVCALEAYVGSRDLAERAVLADRYPPLRDVIPSLAVENANAYAGTRQPPDRALLISSMSRMLVDLTSRQAVLLVLDDLHTAPEATLQIVDSIVRLTQARRLMVMGTFRPEELTSNSPLRGMLGPGDRKGLCHELALPMLQRRECDDLVAALMAPEGPSPTLLDEVWAASSGNPFFITQTLRAVTRTSQPAIERGIWQAREHGTDAITPPIMWMVESYLRRADPRTRLVLSLVALAGPDVSFRELSLAAQEAVDPTLTKTMLLDILDPAVRSTVLAEHGEGYSFPYALFRAALCQDLSHQRREEFHAALAHAIEVHRPSEIAVLAHHSRRSQDVGRPSSQVGGGFRRDAG